MESVINFVISQSIWIPILVGLTRFKIIRAEYLPFYCLLLVGVITEIVSFIIIRDTNNGHGSNAVPTNLFVLAEWLLLAYQFYQWGVLKKRKKLFYFLIGLPALVWIIENLVFQKI